LRKKIVLDDISDIIQSFSIQTKNGLKGIEGTFFEQLQSKVPMVESEEFPGFMESDVVAFIDPRTHLNGCRIFCNPDTLNVTSDIKQFINQKEYNL